ncbi:VWA domain-containing protein [Fangia hongkongensis]|uniref:VWA domain-containing protein n=2 Tax=Fangia hongkongensis TaxID=270495 RepID=UPI00146B400C|nr:VWA domain-containing protein [Fangia hongkongensis]
MLPGILLFMGLGIGILALLNDKAELGDASEAAAFAMAEENKGNNTSVNNAISQSIYQFYFPHLHNIGSSNQFEVGFRQAPNSGGGTHLENHWSYYCQVTDPIYSGGKYYRASGENFKFNSFAGNLFGSMGFKTLEKVVNTGLAKNGGGNLVTPGSRTCFCAYGYTGTYPHCTKVPSGGGAHRLAISFVIDVSDSVTSGVFLQVKELIKKLAQRLSHWGGINIYGVRVQAISFSTNMTINGVSPLSTLKGKLADTINNKSYLDSSIYTECAAGCKNNSATRFYELFHTDEYNKFINNLNSFSFSGGKSTLSAPFLYASRELYTKTDNRDTIVVLITDGHTEGSSSAKRCSVKNGTKCEELEKLDEESAFAEIRKRFNLKYKGYSALLIQVPGKKGNRNYFNDNFLRSIFPKKTYGSHRQSLTSADMNNLDSLAYRLQNLLLRIWNDQGSSSLSPPVKTISHAYLPDSEGAHKITGKLSHSAFAVSTSSPQLIYRWNQSEVPLPH